MTWFKTNDASISNGGTIVTIGDGANTSVVKAGDALIIGSFQPVEVKAVFSGQIELVESWGNSTQSGAAATAMPTSGDFKSATEALRNATKITQDNYKVIQDWGAEMGTVTFVDYEGTEHEARTLQQMDADSQQKESEWDASLAQREAAMDSLIAASNVHMRTEADMKAQQQQNRLKYAADGITNRGWHNSWNSNANVIEEGLWSPVKAVSDGVNNLLMGRGASNTNLAGESVEPLASIMINGLITELTYLGTISDYARVTFPDAEEGTRICNNSLGRLFDYRTEQPARYDDIAPTTNEAVYRAHEGSLLKNGNFRHGMDGWAAESQTTTNIVDGVLEGSAANPSNSYVYSNVSGIAIPSDGEKVTVTFQAKASKSAFLRVRITGTSSLAASFLTESAAVTTEWQEFTFTATCASMNDRVKLGFGLQDFVTGTDMVEIRNVTLKTDDEYVLDSPVDVYGFEGHFGVIDSSNPWVFKHGIIQSFATDIDGITTEYTDLPNEYFHAYVGSTDETRGRGVNFLALSTEDQEVIASNPKNHIYRMKDGTLVQWRIRQRTIRGVTNGKWDGVLTTDGSTLVCKSGSIVRPQGALQTLSSDFTSTSPYFYSQSTNQFRNTHGMWRGSFGASFFGGGDGGTDPSLGYDGKCFFHVAGMVPRLNRGAYHPRLNRFGTGRHIAEDGAGSAPWYSDTARKLTCTADAYIRPEGAYPYLDGYMYVSGSTGDSGSLAFNNSGRRDLKAFDAIYAEGGLSSPVSLMFDAHDINSVEDAAAGFDTLTNGDARGLECLPEWKIVHEGNPSPSSALLYPANALQGFRDSDGDSKLAAWHERDIYKQRFWIKVVDWVTCTPSANAANMELGKWYEVGYIIRNEQVALLVPDECGGGENWISSGDSSHFVIGVAGQVATDIPVSKRFTREDVLGTIDNIVACDALKYGWLGGWLGAPDGSNKDWFMTRRSDDKPSNNLLQTEDNGATWASGTWNIDGVNNDYNSTVPENHVRIITYYANAFLAEYGDAGELLHKNSGLLPMYTSQSHDPTRASLIESLTRHINVFVGNSTYASYVPIQRFTLSTSGKLYNATDSRACKHAIDWADESLTSSDPYGVKILPALVKKDGMVNMQLVFNELKYTVDWGDDGIVRVLSGVDGFTNLNGEYCVAGTATLTLPLGWTKKY